MRRCNIVGFDGFDECIGEMAALFYRMAGYKVTLSNQPVNCDLLVILRGEPPNDSCLPEVTADVHVYNYVSHLVPRYTQWLRNRKHRVIVPHLAYLPTGYLEENGISSVVLSFPPVIPDLWFRKQDAQGRIPGLVHVGNYKGAHGIEGDSQQAGFVNFVKSSDVLVYGSGWELILPSKRCLGKLAMDKVPDVYSRYHQAVGLMYPIQRGYTISGRFFQAPLSGCSVLTEAIPLHSTPPGLILVDWSESTSALVRVSKAEEGLEERAYLYWRKSTEGLACELGLDLGHRMSQLQDFGIARAVRRYMEK